MLFAYVFFPINQKVLLTCNVCTLAPGIVIGHTINLGTDVTISAYPYTLTNIACSSETVHLVSRLVDVLQHRNSASRR